MGRPRGIKRDTVMLDLSDGDWIRVKSALTVGEERDITGKSIKGYSTNGQRVEIDSEKLSFLAAATYIVAWSFVDQDGRGIAWPFNLSLDEKIKVLRELDPETMREIDDVLARHRTPVLTPDAQEAATKNATSAAPGDAAPSLSVA